MSNSPRCLGIDLTQTRPSVTGGRSRSLVSKRMDSSLLDSE
jgi:hypothetical protein